APSGRRRAPLVAARSRLELGFPAPPRPLEGQLLETAVGVDALGRGRFGPPAIRTQLPGQRVVGQVDVEDLLEPPAELLDVDGRDRFHATVEVPGHELGGADEVARHGSGTEPVDAGALDVAAYERSYA